MWAIYIKELLELSRDKRVMLTMILIPLVIMPAILAIALGASAFVANKEQTKTLNFAIQGELEGYQLVALFNQEPGLKRTLLSPEHTPEQAVQENIVDFVLVVEGALPHMHWKLYHNGAKVFSRAKQIIQRSQRKLMQQWQVQQLTEQGMTGPEIALWLKPVTLSEASVADERETVGATLGGFLPYLILVLALSGAMYPAIDVGAGEKERGTLETLLMSPMPIEQLIMGKVAVVATSAFIAGLLTLFSLSIWSSLAAFSLNIEFVEKVLQMFTFWDLLIFVFLIMPVALIFGVMMTAISFYARSFKEAQNYMGLAYTLPFIPLMLALMPGIEMSWGWAMVPLSNVAIAIKELAKGTLSWQYLLVIWANAALIAALLTQLCVRWCRREAILFR